MAMRAIILGCGSSGGVPRVGGVDGRGDWGICDPAEPKNKRMRCSLLVEAGDADAARQNVTSVIVDTSPDFRNQMLAAAVEHVDAVLISHDHADQTHGIDDLRAFALRRRKRVPVYVNRDVAPDLTSRFRYCFDQAEGSLYPAILDERIMPAPGETLTIDGPGGAIKAVPFLQDHGPVDSLGFRFGDLGYSSDVVGMADPSFDILRGIKVWIVDALQPTPHGTHAHLAKTLEWIERIKPARAILTNLHITMDYQTLIRTLPAGVEPAFDGMEIDL